MITTFLFGEGNSLRQTLEGLMSYYYNEELEIEILFTGNPNWISLAYAFPLKEFLDANFSMALDAPELEAEQRYQFRNYLHLKFFDGLTMNLEFIVSNEDKSGIAALMANGVLGHDFERQFPDWAGSILNAQVGGAGKLNHWDVLSPPMAAFKNYSEERANKVRTLVSPNQEEKECLDLFNSLKEVKDIFYGFDEICVAKVHGEDEDFNYVRRDNRVRWQTGLPARSIRFEKNGLPSELFVELECATDLARKFVDFDHMGIPKPFLLSSWNWSDPEITESVTNFLAKLNQEIQKIEPEFRTISREDVSFTAEEMEKTLREGYRKYWPDLF